jgi:trimeric autotransporter adhesin
LLQFRHWRDFWKRIFFTGLCVVGLLACGAEAQNSGAGPVRLVINPTSPAPIPNGKSLKLTVTEGFFRNIAQLTGTHDTSSDVIWASDNPSVISVSSHGLAIAHQPSGTANITAKSGPAKATIQLTAAPAVLQFIVVTPFSTSLAVAGTQQYTAIGHYSDGTTTDLTNTVTWSRINNINGSGGQASITTSGLVTGVTAGIVQIKATDTLVTPNIPGSTFLNVGLSTISITPSNPSVPKGETQQFTATGMFGATPHDVTSSVFWVSQDTTVAKITSAVAGCPLCSPGGIAFTYATGTSGIYAVSGSVSSTVPSQTLTVTPAVVTSIAISPSTSCNPTNVPRGDTCQFTAVATYSDQTKATFTGTATWNSDTPGCTTIAATGLASTLSSVPNPCTANITASYTNTNPPGTVTSNSIGLTVTAHALNSISVSPVKPTQPKGDTQQFTLKGHYTDGVSTIASGAAWSSTNSSVATIDPSSGLATTVAPGTTTIKASYSGLNASTSFTVTAAALASIAVSPSTGGGYLPPSPQQPNTTIPVAGAVQLQAIGTYTDNSTQDVTSIAVWSSSTGATINDPNAPGEATGVSANTVTISAADPNNSNVFGTMLLTVKTISSINVTPSTPLALNPGQQQSFTATINYSGGITQDLTQFDPTWSSSANNIATVDQNGNATAVSAGTATIAVQLGSVACPGGAGGSCATLTVNQPTLQSITVSCDPNNSCTGSGEPVLSLGQTEQMIATGNYSDGSTQDLTQNATWTSSHTSVATIVSNTGFLTTQGLGSTDITATCTNGGACPGATSTVTGTLPLTVTF